MMTVLKVTFSPHLESEKLIPNKNTQENSGKKKKSTLNKRYEQFVQKGKKKKKKNNKQKMSLMYLNSCSILLILTEN